MRSRASVLVSVVGGGVSFLAGCRGAQSALDPAGPAASEIAFLWWAMLVASAVVCIIVLALLGRALWRKRGRITNDPGAHQPDLDTAGDHRSTRWILIGGGFIPAVILVGVFALSTVTLGALLPPKDPAAVVIEVIGRRWWWHIRYLDAAGNEEFVSANEIRLPVGAPIELRLLSDDVIHSLWIPSLQGKLDLIPGRRNVMWLEAKEPGVYRAQCAEYCGVQHARMAMNVVAMAPDDYRAWVAIQRTEAPNVARAELRRGLDVFVSSGCGECHSIRGSGASGASGVIGPDLTHVAGRLTLAAGTLPNTRGHLAGWISNPQELKPGSFMPATELSAADLHALLEYLTSLQ